MKKLLNMPQLNKSLIMKNYLNLLSYMLITTIALTYSCNSYAKNNDSTKSNDDEIEMVIKEVEAAREKGLPLDAKPVAYYFNREANGCRMVVESDVDESWVYDNDRNRCFFFIQSLTNDEEVRYVAIWMYEETKGKISKIFSQSESNFGDKIIDHVKMIQAEIPDGEQTIRTPMLVIACTAAGPRPTSSIATIFLHPESRKTKTLENERLLDALYPESEYITTTTKIIEEEELSDFEAERRTPKLFVTPILKVYTTYGDLVNQIKLPTYETYDEY